MNAPTKSIPVNAPDAISAGSAVRDLLLRENRPFHVLATEAGSPRADHRVAIVVTRPAGPRATWLTIIERCDLNTTSADGVEWECSHCGRPVPHTTN